MVVLLENAGLLQICASRVIIFVTLWTVDPGLLSSAFPRQDY